MLYPLDAMGIPDFSQGAITKSLPKDYYTHICLSIYTSVKHGEKGEGKEKKEG